MNQINIKIEPKLKQDMDRVANDLGLTTTDALRVFMKQFVAHRGFPFAVHIPKEPRYNAEVMQAMHDAKNRVGLTRGTIKDMMEIWDSAQ